MTDDDSCSLCCKAKHPLAFCPVYQGSTVNQRWGIVRENRRYQRCLRVSHHTNDCKRADRTSCDKFKKTHHRCLHIEKKNELLQSNLSPNALTFTSPGTPPEVENRNIRERDIKETKDVPGICQYKRSWSEVATEPSATYLPNPTLSSKCVFYLKELQNNRESVSSPQTHLTMTLGGGQKKEEISEMIAIEIASPDDEDILKPLKVYTVRKPCSNAKNVSRKAVEKYP